MKEFFKSLYAQIFSTQKTGEQLDCAVQFFTSKNLMVPPELADLKFSSEDIVKLAEYLPNSEDSLYLHNFLLYLLKQKRYEEILIFFGKVFTSHIGKVVFSSKNVKNYDITERAFDKFIEGIIWTGLSFSAWSDMLFKTINSEQNTLLYKWKRPSVDYLLDLLLKDEKAFYKFTFDNFSKYGILIFDVLFKNNITSAIGNLVDFYLNNEFEEKRQVKNILKQHFSEVRDYVNDLRKNYAIKNDKLIEIMLIFKHEKDVQEILKEIYFKEKDDNIKRLIAQNIVITTDESVTIAQLKKNSQRFDEEENWEFLDTLLSDFPDLVLYNNEHVDAKIKGYFLKSYKDLCSPYASFEVAYFHKLFEPKSLNNFCEFIANLLAKSKDNQNNKWAFCLIAQNSTPNEALKIIQILQNKTKNSAQNTSLFVKYYVYEHKIETIQLFDDLDRNNPNEKPCLDVLLQGIIESNLYEPLEIERLRDKIIPSFNLINRKIEMEGYTLSVKDNWLVEVSGQDLDNIPKEVLVEQKRLEREIEKQSKRLKIAFHSGRMWQRKDWENYILNSSLMKLLASEILWGRYVDNNLVSVFKIEGDALVNLASIKSGNVAEFTIGIFHPVEFAEPDWTYIFDGRNAPFNQLYIDIFSMSNYNLHSSVVSRFNGFIVNCKTFFERMKISEWKFSMPTLNNNYVSMMKINRELGILAEIDFSPINVNQISSGHIMLGELRFYRLNSVLQTGNNYITNKANSLELIALKDRYFSDIIFEITVAGKK